MENMINDCNNAVKFQGTPENVAAMNAFYEELQWRAIKYNNEDIMRRIYFENGYMRYTTDWTPNFQDLKNMADGFNVGFTNKYAEPKCWLYGEAKYENGTFSNMSLNSNDFRIIQFNKDIALAMYEMAIITNEPKVIFDKLLERHEIMVKSGSLPPDILIQTGIGYASGIDDCFYRSTGNLTIEEITKNYGFQTDEERFFLYAEDSSFEKAKELFDGWSDEVKADITTQPPDDIFDLEQEDFYPAWFKALTYRYFLASQWMVAHLSKEQGFSNSQENRVRPKR